MKPRYVVSALAQRELRIAPDELFFDGFTGWHYLRMCP